MVKLKLNINSQIITILLSTLLYCPGSLALTLNGYTGFASTFDISASSSGMVVLVNVKPGQRIKKGDVLLTLDATLHQARLAGSKAIEKSLLPAVETSRLELERAQELYDRDSLSQVELKNAENRLAEAEGEYQAAQAESAVAGYYLNNTVIRSPVSGRVLQVYTNLAEYIDPAVNTKILVTLVQSRKMKAIALVNSDQWNPQLVNKKATVTYAKKIFNGKVSYIGYKRIKQSSGLPAYELHVTFETDWLIPAEMPVSIEIED